MTFKTPTFDRDGYPTEELLYYIQTLSPTTNDPFEIMEYINEIWHWDNMGKWRFRNSREGCFEISTGGWSGNEDIITALRESMFWTCYWHQSRAGGHYWFHIKKVKK